MSGPPPLILVVDDVEDNRYTLTRRLRREGFERLIEAANGREALEKLESQDVDLVLLDIMMPEIDGFEVLRRMRADTRLRQQKEDIPQARPLAIDEIFVVAGAKATPRRCDLGVLRGKPGGAVIQHQPDLRHVHRRASLAAGKDDVVAFLAA